MATLAEEPVGVTDRTLEIIARQGAALESLGAQLSFSFRALAWAPRTPRRYARETLRLLTEVSFGTGALAVIGGTLGVMIGMTLAPG
jgi:phospholipid/cholesterol/gamma-HCH transport system permease protein